jgi:hypothetical protein
MQRHIYDVRATPLVKSVLEGYNVQAFAEGQTGSGQSETSLRGSPYAFERIFDTSPLVLAQTTIILCGHPTWNCKRGIHRSPSTKLPTSEAARDRTVNERPLDVVVKSVSEDGVP